MDYPKVLMPGGEPVQQAAGDNVAAIYSSHPIAKFKLGPFQFVRGVLKLTADDATRFDELMAAQPLAIRNRVRKSTLADAERIASQFVSSRMQQGITTTADDNKMGGPGSTLLPEGEDVSHANHLQPGASKDKETDGAAEPEFGPTNDKIDSTDGDAERKFERNTPVQESLQASVGGTTGSDPDATGASVAEEESVRNQPDPVVEKSQERSQEAAEATRRPLFNLGNKGDKPETHPVREGDE